MQRNKHAQEIASRFRELVENAGGELAEGHYDELELLIEAGIDTALVDHLERLAGRLDDMARDLRQQAERFA